MSATGFGELLRLLRFSAGNGALFHEKPRKVQHPRPRRACRTTRLLLENKPESLHDSDAFKPVKPTEYSDKKVDRDSNNPEQKMNIFSGFIFGGSISNSSPSATAHSTNSPPSATMKPKEASLFFMSPHRSGAHRAPDNAPAVAAHIVRQTMLPP